MPDNTDTPPPEPWEQQPGESAKAYGAFTIYRDLGVSARSMTEVARRLDKNRTHIGAWSAQHRWVARVTAWDAHVDRLAQEAVIRKREEMIELHAQTARRMMQWVGRRLIGEGDTPLTVDDLTPADLVRMMESAAKLERLSRGVPTEHVEQSGTVDHDLTPALQILLEDQELAVQAENLAIAMAKKQLRKEARGE